MTLTTTKRWLYDRRVLAALWVIIGIISALTKMRSDRHNNYDIYRYVFYNTWNGFSLYAPSTDGGFWDTNHYGPFFSVIIAPFSLLAVWMGLLLWCTLLAVFMYWAVSRYCSLDIRPNNVNGASPNMLTFIIWYCAHELLTALFMQQFNVAIAAIILLSFYFVEKEHDEYATFFIVIGILVKLYGVVGLAFFLFSKHKKKYIISFVAWSILLFCLPMLISSPEYQLSQYEEWYLSLMEKNDENLMSVAQNISLLGMVRKIGYSLTSDEWWCYHYSDTYLLLAGMVVMAIGYFRVAQWKNVYFRHTILAGVMMFVCLFSTGTESSGYIIALTGCVIWYCCAPWKRSGYDMALMVFVIVLTSSPSDLVPRALRKEIIQPYALKALPVTMIWVKLCYELITKNYDITELRHRGI